MLASDLSAVIEWWFILFVFGVGFLPLTLRLFSRFFDKVYLFSKLLGLAITSYVVYVLGVVHFVPFGQVASFVVFVIVALLSFYLFPQKEGLWYLLKKYWPVFVFEEIIFLV